MIAQCLPYPRRLHFPYLAGITMNETDLVSGLQLQQQKAGFPCATSRLLWKMCCSSKRNFRLICILWHGNCANFTILSSWCAKGGPKMANFGCFWAAAILARYQTKELTAFHAWKMLISSDSFILRGWLIATKHTFKGIFLGVFERRTIANGQYLAGIFEPKKIDPPRRSFRNFFFFM